MDIKHFIQDLLDASNAYGTQRYLQKWDKNAVLDDRSVGRIFRGHAGIREYFEKYFIGYQTQTSLVKLVITPGNHAHIETTFRGEFPGQQVSGIFDFSFRNGVIDKASADLL